MKITQASKELIARLGVELPIVQAPMAGVQGHALAAAVCNAGALGSLPCAMLAPAALRQELTLLSSLTRNPFNANFFCHEVPAIDVAASAAWRARLDAFYDELQIGEADLGSGPSRLPFDHEAADVLADFRPHVVSFHFGLPAPDLLARVRGWGSLVLSSATTVAEARWLAHRGVDAIIAQGLEAGAHRGHFLSDDLSIQCGTFALVPQIVAAVDVPVIAAGGIADAAGVVAALSLGAAAAQVGTSYLLCNEATTSAVHRSALRSVPPRSTAITNVFSGRPARGMRNRAMEELGPIGPLVPRFPLASAALAPLRRKAESLGMDDFSPLWAGQNVSGCKEIPAGDLTHALARLLER